MRPAKKIKRLFAQSNVTIGAKADERIIDDALTAIDESKKTKSFSAVHIIGKVILKNPIIKIAAVFVIVVIIGLHQLNISIRGTNIVWADVAERLGKVRSYKAKARRVLTEVGREEPFFEGDILRYFSPEHGSVEESYEDGKLVMLAYCSISEMAALIVFTPPLKMYCRFDLNEELLSVVEYTNPANTEGIIKLFGSERCVKLGRREIDGMTTQGFEVKDVQIFSQVPRFLLHVEDINIRLWVDEETLLPVRVEGEGFFTGLMALFKNCRYEEVMYDIEYDAEIDENIFDPNIPDDYLLIDPASIAEKAELAMLCIVPCGAAIIASKHIKKQRNRTMCNS